MERTAPALINIDLEKNQNKIDIDGSLEVLLTELSFIVSFIYSKMFLEGYELDNIKNMILLGAYQGISKGKMLDQELDKKRQEKKNAGIKEDDSKSDFNGEMFKQNDRAQ